MISFMCYRWKRPVKSDDCNVESWQKLEGVDKIYREKDDVDDDNSDAL